MTKRSDIETISASGLGSRELRDIVTNKLDPNHTPVTILGCFRFSFKERNGSFYGVVSKNKHGDILLWGSYSGRTPRETYVKSSSIADIAKAADNWEEGIVD